MERTEIRLPGPYLRNHDGTNNKKNVKKEKETCVLVIVSHALFQ